MIVTVETLDAYALAKASEAGNHVDGADHMRDCMICTQFSIVKKSDRVAQLTLTLAGDIVRAVIASGELNQHRIARDLQMVYSLGLSAGIELYEADQLAKLEALGGE